MDKAGTSGLAGGNASLRRCRLHATLNIGHSFHLTSCIHARIAGEYANILPTPAGNFKCDGPGQETIYLFFSIRWEHSAGKMLGPTQMRAGKWRT